MSRSRSSSPDTIDIEMDPASRNVRARLSPIPGDPYLGEPAHDHEESDPEEDPSEDEEDPSEDEEVPLSVHLRSPSPILSASPPSPLPPLSPPSSIAPPSPAAPPPPIMPPSPIAPPSPVLPSLRFSSRNEGVRLRWDWMPTSLRSWRHAEQLPVVPTPPTSSFVTPVPTLTQEPVHHTIPVIVARLRTHDEQLEDLDVVLETIPHRVGTLQQQADDTERDLLEMRDDVVTIHTRGVETQDEVAMLRQEIAALRQELAEFRAEQERSRATAASS